MKKYMVSLLCAGLLASGSTGLLATQNNKVSAATVEQTESKPVIEKASGTLEVMVVNENIFTDANLTQKTSRVLPFLSEWRVLGVQKVNGKDFSYNLGGNQWVDAKNVLFHPENQAEMVPATPMKGVFVVKVPGHPTWSTAIWHYDLFFANKYLKPNTAWKVFSKRVFDENQVYYNLGGDQWVYAGYGYLR